MKRKLIILTICMILLAVQPISALSSTNSAYIPVTTKNILNAYGQSSITLSIDFSQDRVDGILVGKNEKYVKVKASINKNILTVSPIDYFEGGSTYSIKLFTRSGKQYQLSVNAVDTLICDLNDIRLVSPEIVRRLSLKPTGHIVMKISPKPDKGFYYPYYLMIPSGTTANKDKKHMVVETNNTGTVSNAMGIHEEWVKMALHCGITSTGAGGYQVSTSLKTPLLIPVFPRPSTEDGMGIYIHALDKEAISIKDGDMKRVDLQLIAMIDNARTNLATRGITIEKKVFMTGFSASGDFINRFLFLHPEYVKAISSSTSTFFPSNSYKGITLNYPLGTADMKELTGITFNPTEYSKIAKYIYTGDQDDHDGVTSDWDKNGAEYINAMHSIFGQELFPDKWNQKIKMINDMGYGSNYQYQIYKGIGHNISENMYKDIVEFFKVNSGDKFVKIQPHVNAY